jgi:predicted membrane protein
MGERAMSSLDKMWASFVALGLMAVASLLITYARTRTKGVTRIILSVIAFLLLLLMVPFALLSMF